MAATVASKVPFYQLSVLLDKIHSIEGKDRKKNLLKEFIDEWRSFHNKLHTSDGNVSDSFFPAMRLLLPQLDRSREAYGIKEHTLAKLYIEILGLGKDSPSAQKLLNFRAPKTAKHEAGDFAAIAFLVLKSRCPDRGSLTVSEINAHLDEIANGHAAKNKAAIKRALSILLRQLSAREQKWLIRIIMKESRYGLGQRDVLGLYHEDAEDLYNVKMNLEKVCHMLHDPNIRLHEIEVSLFSPFRPMLGDHINPRQVEMIMKNRPFFIEIKFDGERMQMHKRKDDFRYFSRSGNDYTQVFGSDRFAGTLTPFIADSFKSTVHSCILDGEMVGYNPETKTIGSKGESFDIKSRDVVSNSGYQPMLCVFDILLLNDEVLANRPLRERRRLLADVFNPSEGRLIYSEISEKSTKEECIEALNDAIDAREEGIMVKNPDSVYKPATRKGGWYKLKPDYVQGVMDELDVLVVGGNFGAGSRSQMLSHFLCAVAVPAASGEKPSKFHSFCRVGSGYTRKELFDFNRRLAPHWKAFEKKNPPAWLELASGLKQKPDAYIEPEHSTILQIRAAEIIASDQYRTRYTLRFPRVEKIRDDKPWYMCMTTTELEDLRTKSSGKLAGKHMAIDGEDEPPKKKRAHVVHAVKPTLMSRFCGVDAATVTKTSDILSGKEFCLTVGSSHALKTDLERKVIEFGGAVVQNPGNETFCVVADKISLKIKNIIAKGCYDVLTVEWLQSCFEQRKLVRWTPRDMIHTSRRTADELASDYDRYGDSFYDDVTCEDLRETFRKMPDEESVSSERIAEIEMQYFPHDSEHGLFRICRVYLDCSPDPEDTSMEFTRILLRLYGATISSSLDDSATHVVVSPRDTSRVPRLQEISRRRRKHFHLVIADWVTACIECGKLVDERPYRPVLECVLSSLFD